MSEPLRAEGLTFRQAAARLGLTMPAAQAAMALHRLMAESGVADPYQAITAPPEDGWKLRRHKHRRYRFEPLNGFPACPGHPTS